ncbi:hypothetical protein W02_01840 [Nitrospira sp. KM1]|uniref:hypothetical protein n=1 Tax=Nitrospira sp. KM1 TaxID=1936990 RepID=UPI0013A78BF5|nr:hypothetical protein [Nitrospira sp. KM1]BCA53044.1 hypothetical protein W02_01840 [Nitrospira sp. KM1]
MARKGWVDRGLLEKLNAEGKKVWFGSFHTKTAARDFYNKAKLEQPDDSARTKMFKDWCRALSADDSYDKAIKSRRLTRSVVWWR